MVDHKRLDALTELVERSGAKLIAVGDGKQLPSIGPGGMFDRLTGHAPTVELETIHRTTDPQEQRAWQALRAGEPERAMAHYKAQGRLHLADTRDQAAESAVQAWAQLTSEVGIDKVALIADSSNKEIDRLNARAQHLRAQRGELGPDELPLSSVHYGLRQGDRVAFIAQHRPQGQPRVENGTRGQVTNIDQDGTLTLTLALDGSDRRLQLARQDAESLRLAYAQHVYRQQGATVDRSVVLTGGWQTSKETRLRPSHPRPPRHRLVPRPRPTRRRRTRPRPDHTPRRTDEPKPSAHPIRHPPRNTRRRRGTPAATHYTRLECFPTPTGSSDL